MHDPNQLGPLFAPHAPLEVGAFAHSVMARSLPGVGLIGFAGLSLVNRLGPVALWALAEEFAGVDGVSGRIGDGRRADHLGDGQRPAHVGEHGRQLVVLPEVGQQLLGLDAVLPRSSYQALGQVVLANLDLLPPTGALLICPPLKIQKGSGSPLRVLALVEDKL